MKKYNSLCPSIKERIYQEERLSRNPDKAVKTRLHQLYGAYIQPNSNKKAAALIEQLNNESITKLLKLHASTSERLPYYGDFYNFIYSHTGTVDRILDLGCGFNPFSLPFIPHKPALYHAVDIDVHTKDILNTFFEIIGLPKYAANEDLATFTPPTKVDLALMLKLFPVLEANSSGRAYSLANELSTTWLVVTFPTKSLGGKKKGMAINYKTSFQDAITKDALNNFNIVADTLIGNELIFIFKHKSGQL